MEDNSKTGILLSEKDIKRYRIYFREMVKLLGIQVLYRAPKKNKHFTTYTEIDSNYYPPIKVGCLFEGTPTQQTMKKLGWSAELDTDASIIHVDYDLPNLQVGSIFIVPGGIDGSKGRVFMVSKMSYLQVYPASITCEIVPEYIDSIDKNEMNDFSSSDFNLIAEEPNKEPFIPNGTDKIEFGDEDEEFI